MSPNNHLAAFELIIQLNKNQVLLNYLAAFSAYESEKGEDCK